VSATAAVSWLLLPGQAIAQQKADLPALDPVAIVSAADDCLGAFSSGEFNSENLLKSGWSSGTTLNDVGDEGLGFKRTDGAVLAISDRGCIVWNPLSSEMAVDHLAQALTARWSIQPKQLQGDLRWVTPLGFIQIHRQGGSPTGEYVGLLVQSGGPA
jgi:hypothetical protein